jgi:VanZ family protein
LFIWIGVIFLLSSNLGSAAHTSLIIEPVLKFLFPDISESSLELVHACVRKTAHFTEYGILALLGVRAFFQASGTLFRLRWLLPILIVALVASLDEFNQSFEPSRTSSPLDVLLDCFGGATATLLCYAVWRLRSAGRST